MKTPLKRIVSGIVACLTILATMPVAVSTFAQPDLSQFARARVGELLVKFTGQSDPQLFRFSSNFEAARALIDFSKQDGVDLVQPNFIYEVAASPNDLEIASQTYLETINAYEGWDYANSAKDVVVAVIDSGIDQTHPDLKSNLWVNKGEIAGNGKDDDGNGFVDDIHGWDFLAEEGDATPKISTRTNERSIGAQHGTIVAGMLAAVGNNGMGVAGIAWRTQLMNLRVLGLDGLGDSKRITRAYNYAIENGADIVNMSLVGTDYDPIMVDLLRRADRDGIITVAAAGNNNKTLNGSGSFPVCYNNLGPATVIGVGAIDQYLRKANFSNYGANCIDISAPGIDVFTTRVVREHFPNQSYYDAIFSGTSFAAPLVTGTVALMKQVYPSMTSEEALRFLQEGAFEVTDATSIGFGFKYALNVGGALKLAVDAVESIPEPMPAQFLALPKAPYHTFGYRYQLPGPILVDPLVLDNQELRAGGINITKESATTVLLSRWDKDARMIYRYHIGTGTIEEVFTTKTDSFDQSVGSIAVGNIDFDPDHEYVVVGGPESSPKVTVFRGDGVLKYQFSAYDEMINGGMHVTLLDTNQDGINEIVTVPATQGPGVVKVFDYTGLMLNTWQAYADNFNGGANVTAADVNLDGRNELIIGPGVTGGPHVKVYNGEGQMIQEFFGGLVTDNGGAHVQVLDLDDDGQTEFVITYHEGYVPVIRRYNLEGQFIDELGIFDTGYTGGVTIVTD